eukprot:INCI4157.1.p1 GENE.INCI4157.1~~INCI4157.1.p1  ORF type:complete len:373 (+),score=81.22 INCI4157.1:265-1383(+)
MPFVLYNVQGEEGDDPQHPNYFRASFPASPVLSDFVAQFPLALLGTFHYRFKKKTDNDYGYVWKDVSSLNERIPLFNGMVWAKVLQTSTEPTDLARAAAAAAADAAAAATAQKKPKRPPALRMKQSTRVSNDKRKPSSQSPRPDKPKSDVADHSNNLFNSQGTSGATSSTSPVTATGSGPPSARSTSSGRGHRSKSSLSSLPESPKKSGPSTEGITMADITLAAGFETKSELVQAAMIQRAKELVAKQRENVAKLKAKKAKAEKLKAAKRAAEGSNTAELEQWAKDSSGGLRKLRTLLCELPTVLWPGTKWKPVDMGDVMDPKRVRLIYFKAMRIVHPDKLKADASPEQKVRAEHIFDALNNSWKFFQAHEM